MNARVRSLFGICLIVLMLGLDFSPQSVHAATTWVVTTLGDNSGYNCTAGDCTLRGAINAASSGDTITFAPSVIGTIHLIPGYGGLTINKNLTINGPGAFNLVVNGTGGGTDKNISVFTVNSGSSLKLSGLSINFGWNLSGGGIWVKSGGTLALDQCSFFDNYAREDGAVLYNHGTVTITRSYFGDNHAATAGEEGYGGAIENNGDGVMTITNSTFTLNGALDGGGAIDNMGNLTIINSTIKNNSAFTGGGVNNELGGVATLINVLLDNNENGNCNGTFASGSTHNLSTDGTCPMGFTQVSSDALKLEPLTGIPAYFPLNYGSVAIDTGINTGCPNMDQTGKYRPYDGNEDTVAICDVGAYEAWPVHYFDNAVWLPSIIR